MAQLKSSAEPREGQRTDIRNIVLVSHYYPPHLGGIEMVVRQQAERLAEQGRAVTVLTSGCADRPGSHKLGRLRILRVRAWNPGESRGVPFPLFSPELLWIALRAIRPADIVHLHDVQYLSSWAAALCCWITRTPYVVTQHVDLVDHPDRVVRWVQRVVHALIGRWIFRRAARVFILNDRVAEFVAQSGVPPRRISLLANGVDTATFCPASAEERRRIRAGLGWAESQVVALFVGRPVPKKGFPLFRAIKVPGVRLVVAGSTRPGGDRTPVDYLGVLPTAELAAALRGADLLVLPSRGEGFPLAVQEAMAAGLAVLTSDDPAYACYDLDPGLIRQVPAEPTAV
ncbi:MAG: glycosyltransferase family 4 protein, partial [Angustibacter sp.]